MTPEPTPFWPVQGARLIALLDGLYSALHSLKNAVTLLPVRDTSGGEDVAAALSYCLAPDNVEAVQKYSGSVESLLEQLARMRPQVESLRAEAPCPSTKALASTVAALLDSHAQVAQRIERLAEHAEQFRGLDRLSPEQNSRLLKQAKRNLNRLHAILTDGKRGLLSQVGRVLEAFELSAIVAAAVGPVRTRAESAGVDVRIAPVDRRHRLLHDPQPLIEVLDGVLSNALDAVVERTASAPDGYRGEITVAVDASDESFEIRVSDNGCGIAAQALEQIERGERVTTKGEGHGAGLISARRRLATYPQSLLRMTSEGVDRGARVTVRIGLTSPPAPAAVPADATPTDTSAPRKLRTQRWYLHAAVAALLLSLVALAVVSRRERAQQRRADAVELHDRGVELENQRSARAMRQCRDYFQQAIQIDPGYAEAYAGLARVNALLAYWSVERPNEAFSKAKSCATQALELDPSLAKAHTSLAFARTFHDRDWKGAEEAFERAVEVDPEYATAHQWYSFYLLATRQWSRSFERIEKAADLDAASRVIQTAHARRHYYRGAAGDYDKAEELCPKVANAGRYSTAQELLGRIYAQQAQVCRQRGLHERADEYCAKAIETLEQAVAVEDQPRIEGLLGYAYALSGDETTARVKLCELQVLRDDGAYVPPYYVACIYAGLGEHEEALRLLREAYQEGSGQLVFLLSDPIFAGLRTDAQFKSLVKELGLDGAEGSSVD